MYGDIKDIDDIKNIIKKSFSSIDNSDVIDEKVVMTNDYKT